MHTVLQALLMMAVCLTPVDKMDGSHLNSRLVEDW